jgi:hypothetical protein
MIDRDTYQQRGHALAHGTLVVARLGVEGDFAHGMPKMLIVAGEIVLEGQLAVTRDHDRMHIDVFRVIQPLHHRAKNTAREPDAFGCRDLPTIEARLRTVACALRARIVRRAANDYDNRRDDQPQSFHILHPWV